jgi:hypothetical protein
MRSTSAAGMVRERGHVALPGTAGAGGLDRTPRLSGRRKGIQAGNARARGAHRAGSQAPSRTNARAAAPVNRYPSHIVLLRDAGAIEVGQPYPPIPRLRIKIHPADCPNEDYWVGTPDLNLFYQQYTVQGGVCSQGYTIENNTLGNLTVPANTQYVMTSNVTITGTLTMQAGSSIVIEGITDPRGAHHDACTCSTLNIDGAFTVNGSAAAPVTISASSQGAGQWGQIVFNPRSSGTLEHLIVADGAYVGAGNVDTPGNGAVVIDGATVSIGDSTITDGASGGIQIYNDFNNGTIVPAHMTLRNDTITNNAGAAVHVFNTYYAPNDTWQWSGLQASGNGSNAILVEGVEVHSGETWRIPQDPGLPIRLNGSVQVDGGATWSVANLSHPLGLQDSGANIGITVRGGGTLNIAGTATTPISVTPVGGANPVWGQLTFNGGSNGSLSYVHLSNGGNFSNVYATVEIDDSSPSLTNVTIDHSATDAVRITGGNNPNINPTLSGDTFTNNAGAAVELGYYVPQLTWAFSALHASSNGCDCIQIDGGHVTQGHTWRIPADPGIVLVFDGDIYVDSGATLDVEGLQQLRMASPPGFGASVTAQGGGTLVMAGTATSPIAVTATGAPPACWGEINFNPGSAGSLSYVHFSYGGCARYGPYLTIYVNDSSPSITNVTIDHGAAGGISLQGYSDAAMNPLIANDTFTGNAGNAVYIQNALPQVSWKLSNLKASGNGCDCIAFDGGDVTNGNSWRIPQDPGLPIEVGHIVNIDNGGTLAIQGLTHPLLFTGGNWESGFNVNGGGTLAISGTATTPIAITAPAQSCWNSITFNPGSAGRLSYVHLSHGGCGLHQRGTNPTIEVDSSPLSITDSIIDGAAADDLDIANGALPTLTQDNFGATTNGVAVWYRGWSSGQPQANATCNWWGDSSGPSSAGTGNGVPVDLGVTYSPWLTTPAPATAAACNGANTILQIQPGWSAISLPITLFDQAPQFLQAVLAATGGGSASVYAMTNGIWTPTESSTGATSIGMPFTLHAGQGYLIYSDRAGAVTIGGIMPASAPAWPLTAGWNMVGVEQPSLKASALLAGLLQHSGGGYAAIAQMANGIWTPALIDDRQDGVGLVGQDFALQPGQGYMLYSDRATQYAPAAVATRAQAAAPIAAHTLTDADLARFHVPAPPTLPAAIP